MTTMLKRVIERRFRRSCIRYFSGGNPLVKVEINDTTGVATVKLSRAPVNLLNTEFLTTLNQTFDILEKNKATGVILTSSLPNIFSAGVDLLELYDSTPEKLATFWSSLQTTWINLYSSPLPTVALINGNALAGGCLFPMSCEYRIMVDKGYVLGFNETRLGLCAPKWLQDTMVNVIGQRQAELALTAGRLFPSKEALKIGLIDEEVATEEDAVASAGNFFAQFEKIPSYARSKAKNNIRAEVLDWLLRNRELDTQIFLQSLTSPHIQRELGLYQQSMKKKKRASSI